MNEGMLNGKGSLPSQTIQELMGAEFISGAQLKNVRPASLDLSISNEIYTIEGIFQPYKGETVRSLLSKYKKEKYTLEKALMPGQMYIIRLNEVFELPHSIYGFSNPKSTSSRLDLHVRLIADGVSRFDSVVSGFKGELWVTVVPQSFPIKLAQGASLNQVRFFNMDTRLSAFEVEVAMKQYKLLFRQRDNKAYSYEDIQIKGSDGSIVLSLDLENACVGYESVPNDTTIELAKANFYDSKKFFKLLKKKGDVVYLKKGCFYIFATHEAVRVPPELACEMVPMDDRGGEFRSHYAGFIDPGWGWGTRGDGRGRPLTLEIRPFEDMIVRHGQPIAKLKFERMTDMPPQSYDMIGSNYIVQSGPRLAHHFKV